MKKRLLAFLLTVCIVLSLAPAVMAAEVTSLSGSGTEADPYMIDNIAGLKFFRDSVNAGETTYNAADVYVALGADIDGGAGDVSVIIEDGYITSERQAIRTSATTFSPDKTCTRAESVTFLWRAAGKEAPESKTCNFTDVPANAYYTNAVLWAVENDITKGTSATTFKPDLECSRAQIVTFLYRACN